MGYLSILSKVGEAFVWAYSHPRLALELALLAALLFIGWRYNAKQAELDKARAEHGELEAGLKQKISVVNGQVEILRRENGVLSSQRYYVPPEGSIVIRQKDLTELQAKYKALLTALSNAATPAEREALKKEIDRLMGLLGASDTEVIVKDRGFTLRPGMGMSWANRGISPRLDLKLAYYKRYSLLLGGDRDGADVGASRHLDDILPWHPQNLEVFGAYRFFRLPGAGLWSMGLRLNF